MSEKTSRYIDPLSDFGFKYLFGRETNKDILINFLNELFEGQKRIVKITYGPSEYAGEYKEAKKVFFDILCTGENGEQFIIEMQRNPQRYFRERCIYYMSRLFNEQLPRGESSWNIALKEVYLIGILEFPLENSNKNDHLHDICLVDNHTGKVFSENFGLKFLELPNFNKSENELTTELDKWFYLFRNMHHLDKRPDSFDSPVFQKIFKIAELANLTEEERMNYDSGLKAYWDYHNSIAYAAEEAEIKGKLEGKLEGKKEEKIEIAIRLMSDGLPMEKVAQLTSLPLNEIQNLILPV
jgi:predicted transposase/invertase (TIGR01784 family)